MEGYKKCPYCGEEIPENAAKCMYCTAWLTPNQTVGNEGKPSPQQPGYQGPAPTAYAYVNTPQPQSPQANP